MVYVKVLKDFNIRGHCNPISRLWDGGIAKSETVRGH
jgi:hypothetical protein